MNRVYVVYIIALYFAGMLGVTRHIAADEIKTRAKSDQASSALYRGDLAQTLEELRARRNALQEWKPDELKTVIDSYDIEIADLENVLTLPEEVVNDISTAFQGAGIKMPERDDESWNSSHAAIDKLHKCLATNLPISSPLRMRAAIHYSLFMRRSSDRVGARDILEKDIRQMIESYRAASILQHGLEFDVSIYLDMELALIDMVLDKTDDAYQRMRELLFPEDSEKRISHYYARIEYASEFLISLYLEGKLERVHGNCRQVLEFYSPRLSSDGLVPRFVLLGEIVYDTYARREEWLFASETCRFILLHEELHAPEYREKRLLFLRARYQALIHLDESEEADKVAADLAKLQQTGPARRSRYTAD